MMSEDVAGKEYNPMLSVIIAGDLGRWYLVHVRYDQYLKSGHVVLLDKHSKQISAHMH